MYAVKVRPNYSLLKIHKISNIMSVIALTRVGFSPCFYQNKKISSLAIIIYFITITFR